MKRLYIYLRFYFVSFLYILLTLSLIVGIYIYSIPQLKLGSLIIYNRFYSNLNSIPEWLYIVNYFIFVFIIAIVIIIGWTIRYSVRKKRNTVADIIFQEKYIPQLFEYLFSEHEYTEEEKKIKLNRLSTIISSDHLKRTVINVLREINAQTKGVINEKTQRLFEALKMDYLVYSYLRSLHVKDKIFAIKTISTFKLPHYESRILKLTKSRNLILRSEAIVAMMHLNAENDPLSFVLSEGYTPTLWDLNIIIKTITELEVIQIDYVDLINSEKEFISLLGIMLARKNNQTQFKQIIAAKLSNPNKMISDEAFLSCISFAENGADYNELINKYLLASENLKLEIITCLRYSPDTQSAMEFLKWVVESQKLVQKVEALKSLFELDFNTIMYYKSSEDEYIRKSCLQILDINL